MPQSSKSEHASPHDVAKRCKVQLSMQGDTNSRPKVVTEGMAMRSNYHTIQDTLAHYAPRSCLQVADSLPECLRTRRARRRDADAGAWPEWSLLDVQRTTARRGASARRRQRTSTPKKEQTTKTPNHQETRPTTRERHKTATTAPTPLPFHVQGDSISEHVPFLDFASDTRLDARITYLQAPRLWLSSIIQSPLWAF